MPIQVFIIEDHPLLTEMLTELINESAGLQVCGTAIQSDDVVARLADCIVDVVLLDASMPRERSLEMLGRLRDAFPAVRCVVLAGDRDRSYAHRLIESGACGYVVKGHPEEIVEAIQIAAGGHTFLSASIRDGREGGGDG